MSAPLTQSDVLYLQRVCSVCGLYTGPLNGIWDMMTDQAEDALSALVVQIRTQIGSFDERTERNILTLMPPAQLAARKFMAASAGLGLKVRIISGSRTYAEQDALYAIGRTVNKDSPKVTNARGGQSNHNFGIAWDVGIFEADGRYMTGKLPKDVEAYQKLAALSKPAVAELEWGGDWNSFPDMPHYQLATGMKTVAAVRTKFEAGQRLDG